jgi:hypothetical protein
MRKEQNGIKSIRKMDKEKMRIEETQQKINEQNETSQQVLINAHCLPCEGASCSAFWLSTIQLQCK